MTANRITRGISIAGIIAALVSVIYASDKSFGWQLIVMALFAAFNALPFILTWLLPYKQFVQGWASWAVAFLTLGLFALSLTGYWQLFFDDVTDAQDGLLFAVLPAYQLIALGVGVLAIRILQSFTGSRN